MFVDLNSFFASVEQQTTPHLRNRPVAVVPMLADSTSCIAASYEAKAYGVKTGTSVRDAKRICPGIQFVVGDHEKYVEFHHKIFEAVENCHPISSIMSIDEAALRLGGRDQNPENYRKLCGEIKNEIYQKAGSHIHCSIGVGPNRLLAKTASDMQKPNGFTVIEKDRIVEMLSKLELRDLPGIGFGMEKRLHKVGIFQMKDLLKQTKEEMRLIWGGVVGERYFDWLKGKDYGIEAGPTKSVGHQHVLGPEYRSMEGAYQVAMKLTQKAATRLRKLDAWAARFYLCVKTVDRMYFEDSVRMLEMQDALSALEVLRVVWSKIPKNFGTPMKITVSFSDLTSTKERNFTFFEDPNRVRLSQAMDQLNQKFGRKTVEFASLKLLEKAAPTRIAFHHIPDFEI